MSFSRLIIGRLCHALAGLWDIMTDLPGPSLALLAPARAITFGAFSPPEDFALSGQRFGGLDWNVHFFCPPDDGQSRLNSDLVAGEELVQRIDGRHGLAV